MPVLAVIPARLGSTRLPHKPLQPLGGVPLVVRVAQRIQSHAIADRLLVATDFPEVASVVEAAGFEACLTGRHHPSGTDRVSEVSARPEFSGYDEVLNVQGDAPFLSADALRGALAQIRDGCDIGSAAIPLAAEDAGNPSVVKVVMDQSGRALYFSRAAIPFVRCSSAPAEGYWQHLGVYAYTRTALSRLAVAPPSRLELAEGLEQLRALELGLLIGVARLREPAFPAVDTLEDLRDAEAQWTVTQEVAR